MSISSTLIDLCFIVSVASVAEHRFINFNNYKSEGCENLHKSCHFDRGTGCQSSLSWAGNSRTTDFSNFSYLDRSNLAMWKFNVYRYAHVTEKSQRDQMLCDFIAMMLKPPCVAVSNEGYPKNKYVIAPPCRSYCKAAETKYMSQLP